MSFGFGIGDFLTAIDLAKRVRSRFVDAPVQFAAISADVKSLSNVLRDIEDVLPARELTPEQETDLKEIAQGARDVLKDLEGVLDKYQELSTAASSDASVPAKARRAWKRLKLDPKEINVFRDRVTSSATLLDAFLGKVSSRISLATKEGVDRLHTRQDRRDDVKERKTILEWLAPGDYNTKQQGDYFGQCQSGTGEWLLDSEQFKSWVKRKDHILFCPGIPGAGKTMLASIVVHYLCEKYQHEKKAGIGYIYLNFRRQEEQSPLHLLTSLLKQFAQRQNPLSAVLKQLYQQHHDRHTRPQLQEIYETLQAVIKLYERCFIVVDALDECDNANGHRSQILDKLFALKATDGANIFATSRFIPEIEGRFQGYPSLEIKASDGDIGRYLQSQFHRLPSFVTMNTGLQQDIKSEILRVVGGMFLLARLHVDSLVGQKSPKAMRSALTNLSRGSGSGSLDVAYKEAMERIEGQIAASCDLAKQVLIWIAFARRRVSSLELLHAIAVEFDEPDLDPENLSEIGGLLSVCAGLVMVDEKSDIVRLVHYTTQTYFEREKHRWFPDAETLITQTCLAYLSFESFGSGPCCDDEELDERLQRYPLYSYAAHNWGSHINVASAALRNCIPRFLTDKDKVFSCADVAYPGGRFSKFRNEPDTRLTRLHLAVISTASPTIHALLTEGDSLECKDHYDRTPLWWAVASGMTAIVKLLLNKGASVDACGVEQQTPLLRAAYNGYYDMVALLLNKGASVDACDGEQRTSLYWAAYNGHYRVVALLLNNGASVDACDKGQRTSLYLAASNGHDKVVGLLADAGAYLNAKTSRGKTALHIAVERQHNENVRLLVSAGADLNAKNLRGETALLIAVLQGDDEIFRLLLNAGADLNAETLRGETALHIAIRQGDDGIVGQLLAREDVNVNLKDEDMVTPLYSAVSSCREKVCRMLLARDDIDATTPESSISYLTTATHLGLIQTVEILLTRADVNTKVRNNQGYTCLAIAVHNGHLELVKLLIETGAFDANSRNEFGNTALALAASRGILDAEGLLLATNDVRLGSQTGIGDTPLLLAARYGHLEVAGLLLATNGVQLDSRDDIGNTPLAVATKYGHIEIARLLLTTNGVQVDSRDNFGGTPLALAADNGHVEMMKVLLDSGADPMARDLDGVTALHWAAKGGHLDVVRLLLATNGIDVESPNDFGNTPLAWAAYRGNVEVVTILLENGADPRSRNSHGRTPLDLAATPGWRPWPFDGFRGPFPELVSLLRPYYPTDYVNVTDPDGHGGSSLPFYGVR